MKDFKITDEQKEKIIDLIGDTLVESAGNGDLHYMDILEAASTIAGILTGIDWLVKFSFQIWRATHREIADSIIAEANKNGITITTEIVDKILEKTAAILGKEYPPIKPS